MGKRLLLLALVIALAVTLGFVSFTPWQSVELVRVCGYWFIALTSTLFMVLLVRSLKGEGRYFRQRQLWWRTGALLLVCAGFLHVHERHEFKIVADEVVLQLTAQRMHQVRQASATLRGYEYAGNFLTLATYVDKRPLFFPFLLSLVHDLTGYRVANVYLLNGLLSVVLVGMLWLVAQRIGGGGGGTVAVVLLMGIPLVAQNACGGGFELLNMAMILLTLWLGLRLAERPLDSDRLSVFVLSGALLAQVRYESVIFVIPVGATVAYLWWHTRKVHLPAAVIATPLLLMVVPLHLNVFKVMESTWQLNDVAGSDHPFGFRYFYDNVGHALNFFFSFDGSQPSSWFLAVIGMIGIGFFVMLLYRQHRVIFGEQPARAVCCIFLLGLMLHTGLMLCYFWGKWDDPIIRRLSLPAHLLLIFGFVFSWPHLVSHPRRWKVAMGAGLAYILAFSLPSMALHRYSQENFAARTYAWLGDFISKLDDRPVIAIDQNAGLQWFLYGKSGVAVPALAARPEAFIYHYKHRSFADFFVVQRAGVDAKTGERWISIGDQLGDGIKLELVAERAFAPMYLVRLSRIVGIDEDKFKAWAANYMKDRGRPMVTVPVLSSQENDQLVEWLKQLP